MLDSTDRQVLEAFPADPVDHDNKHYYYGRLHHQLLVNRCATCKTWSQPPRAFCPECWSDDVVPTPVSGKGTIYMAIFLHQGPELQGVDYSIPYPVVVAELAEQTGLRFTATISDTPHESIVIGAPVELTWIDRNGVPTPAFRVTETPDGKPRS